ncbi:MAG: aa3-type cytochrome c oxidase subunit IV [Kiloniellaceae bacterium]
MAENEMLEEHQRTWHGFVKLLVYSVAAVVLTLILMAAFLL